MGHVGTAKAALPARTSPFGITQGPQRAHGKIDGQRGHEVETVREAVDACANALSNDDRSDPGPGR